MSIQWPLDSDMLAIVNALIVYSMVWEIPCTVYTTFAAVTMLIPGHNWVNVYQ